MESISDVVDEVIQNCPIDVRRPLYKVRCLVCSLVKGFSYRWCVPSSLFLLLPGLLHYCDRELFFREERSGMSGNMTLPTEGFLKLSPPSSPSFFPFFLNPGWPRFRTCDSSASTSLALGFQARVSMPGLSYLFFLSGKLDLKLDSLSHMYWL